MNQPPTLHSAQPLTKKNGGSKFLRVIAGMMGGFGGLLSLPLFLASVIGLTDSDASLGIAIAVAVFFGLCALVSTAMLVFAFKPRKEAPFVVDAQIERQVLQIANNQRGVLTLGSLAMNSSLSSEQAQLTLDEMVRRNIATTTFDQDGMLLYRFAGLSRGPAHVVHQKSGAQAELDAFDRELGRTSLDFDSSQAPAHHDQAAHHSPYKKNS